VLGPLPIELTTFGGDRLARTLLLLAERGEPLGCLGIGRLGVVLGVVLWLGIGVGIVGDGRLVLRLGNVGLVLRLGSFSAGLAGASSAPSVSSSARSASRVAADAVPFGLASVAVESLMPPHNRTCFALETIAHVLHLKKRFI